ncbi:MAG: hypothetical protein ISR58_19555 [Anaerolineales bacterium]|nr:hypothetical protein [Anaerolineales bacterium]
MFRKKPMFGVLMTVFVILALVAGGFALFRLGFAQGYSTNIIAEGDGSTLTYPDGLHPGFGRYYGHPMGFFFFGRMIGMFFFIGLLFMFFGGIRRMFWYRRWKHAGGRDPDAWKDCHHHQHHWGPPPWARDEEVSTSEDKTDEASEEAEKI